MRRKILIIVSRVMRIVIVSCVIAIVFNSLSPKGSLISWKRVIEDVLMFAGSMFLFFRAVSRKQLEK